MTLIPVLFWTLACCCFTGCSGQVTVTQPPGATSTPGSTATITFHQVAVLISCRDASTVSSPSHQSHVVLNGPQCGIDKVGCVASPTAKPRPMFPRSLGKLLFGLGGRKVVGLVVGLSGVYLLKNLRQSSSFFSHGYITLPAILALASAALLLAVGCLGSWLSLRESAFLQGLFVYLLVLVFCLESTASALAYFHSTKLDSEMAPLSGVFQNYTGRSQDPDSRAVDVAQEELQCCGVHDYRDWLETSWFNRTGGLGVPHSCCNSTFPSCNGTVDQPWQLYPQGCRAKLETSFQLVLSFIIWGSPLVFLVEIMLFLTMAQLMRDQPHLEYRVLDKN